MNGLTIEQLEGYLAALKDEKERMEQRITAFEHYVEARRKFT